MLKREQSLAEAQLRDAGLRVTAVRVRVLSALLAASSALTHQELLASLTGTDRVTLYRTLDSLIASKLAHKIAGSDRAFRYGAGAVGDPSREDDHRHGHFTCTGCGKVFCLGHADGAPPLPTMLQKLLQDSLAPGFQSHNIELTIKGWCADCAHH